jgi:polar amino acid transport system substrate-binding protein
MGKRRVFVAVLGALVAAVGVAAGAQARTEGGGAPTKEPGKLIVGFDLPAPTFWNGTAAGTTIRNPSGFEVDLAWAIAARLGISKANVEFLRAPFTGLFKPGAKPFDFALEEITITAARKRVVDFSTPYFDANQGVMIAKGVRKPTSLASLKSLQLCGQATTTGLDYIQTRIRPTKKPLVYQSLAAAFQAVSIKRCDALIMDVPIVLSELKKNPSKYGGVVGQIVTNEKYGALFQKGSRLLPQVNAALKTLKANGTIDRLQRKWFRLSVSSIPVLR